jgi:mannosyltransferase OCH1-like enzyme
MSFEECAILKPLETLKATRTYCKSVPRIIHQTWKTETVPDHWLQSQHEWKRLHPEWTYVLWTDEDIRAYILATRPHAWRLFETQEYSIQKVDLFRYFVLHDFGGLYCDLDIVPTKNIEAFLGPGSVFLVESANRSNVYTNALMISDDSANAKAFWSSMVYHVQHFPETYKALASTALRHLHIMMSTGPLALTHVVMNASVPITVLPKKIWNPWPLHLAGQLSLQQNREALVQILDGSSWHELDSSIWSFLGTHQKLLKILVGLAVLYYVVSSLDIRHRFVRLCELLKKRGPKKA